MTQKLKQFFHNTTNNFFVALLSLVIGLVYIVLLMNDLTGWLHRTICRSRRQFKIVNKDATEDKEGSWPR